MWRNIFTPWLRRAAAENARVAKLLNELPGEVNVDRLVAEATSTKVVKAEVLQPVGPQAAGPKDPLSAPVSAVRKRVSSLTAKRIGERRSGDGGRRSTLEESTTTPGSGVAAGSGPPPPATKKVVGTKLPRMGTTVS